MASNLIDLIGPTALVVGASRGIGRPIAQGFARAGASVVLASQTEADLLQLTEAIRAIGAGAESCLNISLERSASK